MEAAFTKKAAFRTGRFDRLSVLTVCIAILISQTRQRVIYLRFANFLQGFQAQGINVTVGTQNTPTQQLVYQQITGYSPYLLNNTISQGLQLTVNTQSVFADFQGFQYNRYTVVLGTGGVSAVIAVVYNDLNWAETEYNITSPYGVNMLWRIVVLPLQTQGLTFLSRDHGCLECGYIPINTNYSTLYKLDNSIWRKDVRVQYTEQGTLATKEVAKDLNFDSQGIYTLFYVCDRVGVFYDIQSGQVILTQDQEPEAFYGALLILVLYCGMIGVWRTAYNWWRKDKPKSEFRESRSLRTKRTEEVLKYNRNDALDTIRGIAVLFWLFCKAGGGNFTFFNESLWEGFTYGDLPEFIIAWTMGFCIPLAHKNQQLFNQPKYYTVRTILLRGMLTFLAGLVTNKNQNLDSMIFGGFLQHLALSYMLVGSLYSVFPTERLLDRKKHSEKEPPASPMLKEKLTKTEEWNKQETLSLGLSSSSKESRPSMHLLRLAKKHGFLPYFGQWNTRMRTVVVLSVAVANLLVFKLVSTPGCPAGYSNPGGLADNGDYAICTGGLLGYVDMSLFGVHHLPVDPACKFMYQCRTFSRYSLLSLPNFVLAVYLGLMAGETNLCYRNRKARLSFILFVAAFCSVFAVSLAAVPGPQQVPLSKAMWSVTFVLLANVFTSLVYFFTKLLFDRKLATGWPFKAAGLNTFALVLTSGIVGNRFPLGFQNSGGHVAMLCSNLTAVTVWSSLALVLHKYRFYIKY